MVVDPQYSRAIRGLDQATTIDTRRDLEKWGRRVGKELRYAVWSFLTGTILTFVIASTVGLAVLIKHHPDTLVFEEQLPNLVGLLGTSLFFGVLTLFASMILLLKGLSSYRKVMYWLYQNQRVCHHCGSISLFDDKYIERPYGKKHLNARLIPAIYKVEKNEVTSMYCESCLDQYN